jgi:uncharacterized membrane-anchored protein
MKLTMTKIGFIGAYDKTDFVVYIAKILVEMGKRVLLVDGTITQKTRYTIPTMENSNKYITEFEGIDIAVGFKEIKEIKEYLGVPQTVELSYDIALLDVDTIESVRGFDVENCEKIYFVTSFDLYSIKKGIESVSNIKNQIHATKVFFSMRATKEEDDYLNYITANTNIIWDEERIFFPFELGDQTVIYKNQRVSKIKFKQLSTQYKEGLMYIAGQITGEESYQVMKRTFKKIEKNI